MTIAKEWSLGEYILFRVKKPESGKNFSVILPNGDKVSGLTQAAAESMFMQAYPDSMKRRGLGITLEQVLKDCSPEAKIVNS